MIKKRTIVPKAIVFGTDATANLYAFQNETNRSEVILATQPDKLDALSEEVVVDVVRVPEDVWKPSTYPDEARVKETERKIKEFNNRGGKTRRVDQ